MTDIVEQARRYIPCSAENVLMNDLADEIQKLRILNAHWGEEVLKLKREIETLRNFLGAIQHNVELALGDYGQPTGKTDMAKVGGTYRWVVPPG